MSEHTKVIEQDRKRQHRERIIIACLVVVVIILSSFGLKLFDIGLDMPVSNSILIFALININIILLLLLLFLTMRNLVKLLFERKKGIMGAKLRTKLVIAFITLSLLPTIILFFASAQFISTSIEYWYTLPIERSLTNSFEVGKDSYEQMTSEILYFGNSLGRLTTYHGYMLIARKAELEKFIDEKRIEYRLAAIKIFSRTLELRAESLDDTIDLTRFPDPPVDLLSESFEKGNEIQDVQSSSYGKLVNGIVPIFSRTESKAVVGLVVLQKFIPRVIANRLDSVISGLEEYQQFKKYKNPVKVSGMIWLSIVTLLIIFSSVWFGFFLSKGITVPIQQLAEGTERIAAGDYDFFIDMETQDEIGVLVNSFNRMTMDLKTSKKQLEETNEELIRSSSEIEKRRLYMEIVLANIAAGVISADVNGVIQTINKSAKEMLNIKGSGIVGKNYRKVMGPEQVKIIDDFLEDRNLLKRGFLQKQLRVSINKKTLAMLVSINMLRNDKGRFSGLVAVFEDLSQLEQTHRVAAWREVARRIAHEVKNPLTPIQLSAQRLRKKYRHLIGPEDSKVFEECTNMIINQAEGLKRLVNEFSNYARMPSSNPVPDDINQIIEEAAGLYKETGRNIKVIFNGSKDLPEINVDREQIKRVMINLLDNAIASSDASGQVIIDLSYDNELEAVRIEVSDNGKGIPPENKMRLFEPYFSTKKHGTGLGLAIVNTIIRDHNGFIDVQDNKPNGTRFIIELPARV